MYDDQHHQATRQPTTSLLAGVYYEKSGGKDMTKDDTQPVVFLNLPRHVYAAVYGYPYLHGILLFIVDRFHT